MRELADLLLEILPIDATTGREGAMADALAPRLAALGLSPSRQALGPDGRCNLVAVRGDRPAVLFSTHLDTVPPHLPCRRDGDVFHGRGACDTKGAIAAMLEAGRRLRERGQTDFGYLLVVGEEVDHVGARKAGELSLRPRRIILAEPTGNRPVRAQKGILKLRIAARGRAAHSGLPQLGVSAIDKLIDALLRLRALDLPRHAELGQTTFNVGRIEGGVAANVVAPAAQAEVLFRVVGRVEDLQDAVTPALGQDALSIEVLSRSEPQALDVPPGMDGIVVAFNTDAAFLRTLGPVTLLGPGDMALAHTADERITLTELRAAAEIYEQLALDVIEGRWR